MTEDVPQAELPEWAQRFVDERMTLQDLGDLLGITREGARLRLKKLGITPVGIAARAAYRSARVQEDRDARVRDIMETRAELRDVLIGLARAGTPREPALQRIAVFFPELDPDDVRAVAEAWQIVFPTANLGGSIFSDAALEGAMSYLVGSHEGLRPDPGWAAVHLADEVISDVSETLAAAQVAPCDIATVLGVIGAAQRAARERPLTITGKEYEALREDLLEALGMTSAKGFSPWPPTRQTYSKRYGGWNDALTAMGLATSGRGRPKGLLRFSQEDYENAVTDFLQHVADTGTPDTFVAYDGWARGEGEAGRQRPSGASLRNVFGSWNEALLAATTGFESLQVLRAAGTSLYTDSDLLDSLSIYLQHAQRVGDQVSYLGYSEWAVQERAVGRPRPSAASIQKRFGSWNGGLRAARKGGAVITSPIFRIVQAARGVDARGQLRGEDFILLEGSRVVAEWRIADDVTEGTRHAYTRYLSQYQLLRADGSIAVDDGTGRVTCDLAFDSTSAAASIALGRGASGRTSWVTDDGVTYGDWEQTAESLSQDMPTTA